MIRNLSMACLAVIPVSRYFWTEHPLALFCSRLGNLWAQTRFPVAVIPGISLICVNRTNPSSTTWGDDTFYCISATISDVD